jgi:hypothetical protein
MSAPVNLAFFIECADLHATLWESLRDERGAGRLKRIFMAICSALVLGRVVAQDTCPTEIKVILASPAAQSVVSTFGFKKKIAGVVYFFDTDSLDLLLQGVIIRVRQGGSNDLTVKLRPPNGTATEQISQLRERFPCEVDRTTESEIESYAIGRQYKAASVAEIGTEIHGLLSDSQKQLLKAARVSIDWTRVRRIASINSTQWKTSRRSSYGRLALELWEWPAGKILEVSAKISPAQDASKHLDLQELVEAKGFSLSLDQDTKTTTVLRAIAGHSPARK